MLYKNHFLRLVVFCALLNATQLNAQDSTITDKFIANKKGFFVGGAYIYDYAKPVKSFLYENTYTPFVSNTNPHDSIYRFMTRRASTSGFGFQAGYNKPFSKRMSFSFGLEIDQRKSKIEYVVYEDARLNSPDPVSYVVTRYSVVIPLRLNYYAGRFMISAGNNIGAGKYVSTLIRYDDGSQIRKPYIQPQPLGTFYIELSLRETLSFQLLKNKNIYLQLSAEQYPVFYGDNIENLAFMAGGTYYF